MAVEQYVDKTLASNEIERCIGSVTKSYMEAESGPYSETTRISYITPSDRRAVVKLLYLYYWYWVAPSTGNIPSIKVYLNNNPIMYIPIPFTSKDRQKVENTPNLILNPGDEIRVTTYDYNKDSTILYALTLVLNEYYL